MTMAFNLVMAISAIIFSCTATAVLATADRSFAITSCGPSTISHFSGLYFAPSASTTMPGPYPIFLTDDVGFRMNYTGSKITAKGFLAFQDPTATYHLDLVDTRPSVKKNGKVEFTAPDGYYTVYLNGNASTSGFEIPVGKGNRKQISESKNFKKNFASFAACRVSAVEGTNGRVSQVLYRSVGTPVATGQCADIDLYARYLNGKLGKNEALRC